MIYGYDLNGNGIDYDNYVVTMTHPKLKILLSGIIDDDTLNFGFETELSEAGNALMDKIKEHFKAFQALDNIHSSITGASISESLLANTIQRPTSKYGSLPLSFKCTFYEGMKLKEWTCPSYTSFVKQIAKIHLPIAQGGAYLRTPQMDIEKYAALFAAKLLPISDGKKLQEQLWKVRIGNIINLQGFWMTKASIEQKHAYDEKGKPLIWSCSFEFVFFRQLTQSDNMFI